jgi:hypothetical protein
MGILRDGFEALAQASPMIMKRPSKNQVECPLHEARKNERVENMRKLLREQAKIEYVPSYNGGRHRGSKP